MKKTFAVSWSWIFILLLAVMVSACSKSSKNPVAPPEEGTNNIIGTVSESDSGLAGVSVHITGGNSVDKTATTNSDGAYAFSDLAEGTYAITPSKSGYSFNPASATVTISDSDKTVGAIVATKTGSGYKYTIMGVILGGDSGLSDVTVHITGNSVDQKIITDASGIYAFSGLANGTYTITPARSGYIFNPASAKVIISGSDKVVDNIIASAPYETPNFIFVSIPGGTFQMGDVKGNIEKSYHTNYSLPIHIVTISSFEMSRYEVTNAQYVMYLSEALSRDDITVGSTSDGLVTLVSGGYYSQTYLDNRGIYKKQEGYISYSEGKFSVASGKENWPVEIVTWYGAEAFARYYGFDLPREAEWEYACRGGKQYEYGTDDGTISTSKANYQDSGIGHPVDVGSYPPNPFGLYDMSGNAFEWCNDWFGNYTSGSSVNPTGPSSKAYFDYNQVLRGGNWNTVRYTTLSAWRQPSRDSRTDGFRVVRRSAK